ncbi:hypothetical protein FSOLCH5_008296 [Fusarium solani]
METGGVQKKRGATVKACLRCHRRKQRCVGFPACSNCEAANIPCSRISTPSMRRLGTLSKEELLNRIEILENQASSRVTYDGASPTLSQQDDDWDPSYNSTQEPPQERTRQTPRFSPEISTTLPTTRDSQQRSVAISNEQQGTHQETIWKTDPEIRRQILTTYRESMHRRVPFCDYTEILQTNEQGPGGIVLTDSDRIKLLRLYMSCAIGAAVMQLTGVSPGPRPETYFTRALEIRDSIEEMDLATQTEVLLWIVLYKLRACFSSEVWYLIGSAVRTAIDADLHREHHYTTLSTVAAERHRFPSLWTPARANDLRVCSSSLYAAAERNPAIRKYCDTLDAIIEAVSEYVEQVLSTPGPFTSTRSAISSPAEDKSPRNAFEKLGHSLKELKFEFPSHAYPEYRLEDGYSEAAFVHADLNLDAIGIFGDVDLSSIQHLFTVN